MIKIASLPIIAAALLACGLSTAQANAATRTFVSGKGTDTGACPVTAPCRTFAFALTQTAAGGEIDVVDSAGYGAMIINKSISIVNDGAGVAGIQSVPGMAGVAINAGANDSVHLRGLTIDGLGVGTSGILFNTGGNLTIEDCVVRHFRNAGIFIRPSTSSRFSVSNTIASSNVGGGSPNFSSGILVLPPGSAAVTGMLSKVTANNNGSFGIRVLTTTGGSLDVTIVESEAFNNNGAGFSAVGVATTVFLRNVVASGNGVGLNAFLTAIIRVAHSVVTKNSTGLDTIGGTIFSYGDNDIDGNTNNNTGVLTPLAMH
jgi:hypothetical protein